MAARRLLNRAVASSSLDPRFLDDFAQLVASEPHALVRSCVECAGIDAEQAELVFQLLVHSPTLSTIDDAAEQRAQRAPPSRARTRHGCVVLIARTALQFFFITRRTAL